MSITNINLGWIMISCPLKHSPKYSNNFQFGSPEYNQTLVPVWSYICKHHNYFCLHHKFYLLPLWIEIFEKAHTQLELQHKIWRVYWYMQFMKELSKTIIRNKRKKECRHLAEYKDSQMPHHRNSITYSSWMMGPKIRPKKKNHGPSCNTLVDFSSLISMTIH